MAGRPIASSILSEKRTHASGVSGSFATSSINDLHPEEAESRTGSAAREPVFVRDCQTRDLRSSLRQVTASELRRKRTCSSVCSTANAAQTLTPDESCCKKGSRAHQDKPSKRPRG